MPMTYSIDAESRLVRIIGSGRVDDADMVQCIKDLRADPRLEPDMNTLSDMRGIEVGFTSQGVARMLGVMQATSQRRSAAKAAIVVESDVAFGMGRMVEMRSEEHAEPSFRIFREMTEACRWLGID